MMGCKKEENNSGNGNDITPTPTVSSAKRIIEFGFVDLGVEAVINEEEKTVSATVPYGTNVSALSPTIVISKKATISPASEETVDFTYPVTYTVTAENGSQVEYTATVTIEEPAISDMPFVGTWGVERIDYYNIDYAGNPILASMVTYEYNVFDMDNNIRLVFREDKTGEMLDSAIDSLIVGYDSNEEPIFIYCPDTVVVNSFTYLFDEADSVLYMNMEYGRTFRLEIIDWTEESFIYENNYDQNYMEKAYLKRLSYQPTSSAKPSGKRLKETKSLLGKR